MTEHDIRAAFNLPSGQSVKAARSISTFPSLTPSRPKGSGNGLHSASKPMQKGHAMESKPGREEDDDFSLPVLVASPLGHAKKAGEVRQASSTSATTLPKQ